MNKITDFNRTLIIAWSIIRVIISISSFWFWLEFEFQNDFKLLYVMLIIDFIFGIGNVLFCILKIFYKVKHLFALTTIFFIFSSLALVYRISANFYTYFVFHRSGFGIGVFVMLILILQIYVFKISYKKHKHF
jgi:hypothetical protein